MTSLREGQERVEIRPGVFVWLNAEDRKRFAERQAQPVAPIETGSAPAPEAAVIDIPSAGTPRRRK